MSFSKILVTGNKGILGSEIVKLLGNRAISFRTNENKRNIMNVKEIDEAMSNVEAIIHCAAKIPGSNEKITNYDVNTLGTKLIVEAANRYHVPILHVSSQAVYGLPTKLPVDENYSYTGEIDEYATSKLIAEKICIDKSETKLAIMRVSSIYSEKTLSRNEIIGNLIRQALNGKIEIYGSGNRVYDFVHVSDVSNVAINLLGENGIFNVGSGTPTSINELSAIIHNYIKCEISYNMKESNIKGIWLNINKIKQLISYNPICLDEGLVLSGIKDF